LITLAISIWLAVGQAHANKTADRAANSADRGVAVALQALQAANEANKLAEKQNDITSAQTEAAESEIMVQIYDYCLEHEQVSLETFHPTCLRELLIDCRR
jgi:hypothetical protein